MDKIISNPHLSKFNDISEIVIQYTSYIYLNKISFQYAERNRVLNSIYTWNLHKFNIVLNAESDPIIVYMTAQYFGKYYFLKYKTVKFLVKVIKIPKYSMFYIL